MSEPSGREEEAERGSFDGKSRHRPGGVFIPPAGSPRSPLPESPFTDLNDSDDSSATSSLASTSGEHEGRDADEGYHETVHDIDNRDAATPDRSGTFAAILLFVPLSDPI